MKCAHCKEMIYIGDGTFSGIPKKKFCAKCWYRIHTIWKAQKYILEDPKLWSWTLKIKITEDE